MFEIVNAVLRSIFAYILLLTVARVIGRKAVSQMTFFNLSVMITLGAVTGGMALGRNSTTAVGATVIVTLGALSVLTAYLNIKSSWIRKLVNSEPVTAIENVKIINQNLKKVRYSINELTGLLREKNIFNYADVEFAIIEVDGQLSVLPKSQKAPLTPSDLKMPTGYKGLTKDLIMDGRILTENLNSINQDENWLKTQLSSQGYSSPDRVFYAGLDSDGKLYISPRQPDTVEYPGQHGFE